MRLCRSIVLGMALMLASGAPAFAAGGGSAAEQSAEAMVKLVALPFIGAATVVMVPVAIVGEAVNAPLHWAGASKAEPGEFSQTVRGSLSKMWGFVFD